VALLLDPGLCALPWEALPLLKERCSSIGRCFSAALLSALLNPGQGSTPQAQAAAAAAGGGAGGADAGAAVVVPTVELEKLSYIVDPCHEQSSTTTAPGGCCPAGLRAAL
jgi:hypothetical protein